MNMDPGLWGTLTMELLELVFSRLPVVDICKLRLVSKLWKQAIDSADSDFGRLLERTRYPSMLGVITLKSEGQFCGMVVDVKTGQRQSYASNAYAVEVDPSENYVTTMGAADGGLVCFVSRGSMRPPYIIVMNPLTRKKVQLPDLLTMDDHVVPNVLPLMVQLTMDRHQWQYKVLVVGNVVAAPGKGLFAQVYDSKTKTWMVVGAEQQTWGRIYGCAFHSYVRSNRRLNSIAPLAPCMYDFAAGGLHYLGKNVGGFYGPYAPYIASRDGAPLVLPFDLRDNIAYTLLKNRLFVLRSHGVLRSSNFYDYFISEFVLEKNATAWVEVRQINNLPFDEFSGIKCNDYHSFSLGACKGFLLLFLDNEAGYIYDLSGCYWLELPSILPRPLDRRDDGPVDLMCELRWNAIP